MQRRALFFWSYLFHTLPFQLLGLSLVILPQLEKAAMCHGFFIQTRDLPALHTATLSDMHSGARDPEYNSGIDKGLCRPGLP